MIPFIKLADFIKKNFLFLCRTYIIFLQKSIYFVITFEKHTQQGSAQYGHGHLFNHPYSGIQ